MNERQRRRIATRAANKAYAEGRYAQWLKDVSAATPEPQDSPSTPATDSDRLGAGSRFQRVPGPEKLR